MVNKIVVNAAIRSTVDSINRTQKLIDQTTLRLATGLRVNSAIDNPKNFFAAFSLTNRANDLNRLLDGIGQSVRTVQEGLIGTKAVSRLLEQAEAIAIESRDKLQAGVTDPAIVEETVTTASTPLTTLITNDNPVGYWRLNDAGSPAVNLGSGGAALDGTYFGGPTNGAPALYTNGGDVSTDFSGAGQRVNIPDSALINTATYAQRTVELVFNADNTGPRQVLYEEGATVNGLTIYIDGGLLYITGEDDGAWVDANINAPIVAGQTYHTAFVYDRFTTSFTGYLDGVNIGSVPVPNVNFPSHSGNIGIGGAPDGVQWHDGESGGGWHFDGQISDVAVYNTALSAGDMGSRAASLASSTSTRYLNENFNTVLDQIDLVVIDANYRGINLLANDDLVTDFNETRSNHLITEGIDISSSKLGIGRFNFNSLTDLEDIIDSVREAINRVRTFERTLSSDLGIISTRGAFTEESINTHLAGAEDLTLADINEESANQLANETRLNMGTTALNLAAESQASILTLVAG